MRRNLQVHSISGILLLASACAQAKEPDNGFGSGPYFPSSGGSSDDTGDDGSQTGSDDPMGSDDDGATSEGPGGPATSSGPSTTGEGGSTSSDDSDPGDPGGIGTTGGGSDPLVTCPPASGDLPPIGMYSCCAVNEVDGMNQVSGCMEVPANLCLFLNDTRLGFCTISTCADPGTDCEAPPGTTATAVPTCVEVGTDTNVCALVCSDGKSCPAGMTCQQVAFQMGGPAHSICY